MARNGHHEGRHGAQTTLQDVLYIFQLQRVIAERQALESLNRKLVPWKQISSCWPHIFWANFLFLQMVVIFSKGIPTNMALDSDFNFFKTIQPWSLTTCWKTSLYLWDSNFWGVELLNFGSVVIYPEWLLEDISGIIQNDALKIQRPLTFVKSWPIFWGDTQKIDANQTWRVVHFKR